MAAINPTVAMRRLRTKPSPQSTGIGGDRITRRKPPVVNSGPPTTSTAPNPAPTNYVTPFDRYYEEQMRRLAAQEAGLESQYGLEEGRLKSDVESQRGNLSRDLGYDLEGLQNRLASQGILRSGINVAERGRLGEEYSRNLGSLQQAEARGLSDLARSLLEARSGISGQREAAEFARTRAAQEFALEAARNKAQAQTAGANIRSYNKESRRIGKDIQRRAAGRRLKRKKK